MFGSIEVYVDVVSYGSERSKTEPVEIRAIKCSHFERRSVGFRAATVLHQL